MTGEIRQGQLWETGPWRETPRRVVIDEVTAGEVNFHFEDGQQTSRCSISAFRRTYEPAS